MMLVVAVRLRLHGSYHCTDVRARPGQYLVKPRHADGEGKNSEADEDDDERVFIRPEHGVVVSAIMVRSTDEDPARFEQNWWWTKWHNDVAWLRRRYYDPSIVAPGAEDDDYDY